MKILAKILVYITMPLLLLGCNLNSNLEDVKNEDTTSDVENNNSKEEVLLPDPNDEDTYFEKYLEYLKYTGYYPDYPGKYYLGVIHVEIKLSVCLENPDRVFTKEDFPELELESVERNMSYIDFFTQQFYFLYLVEKTKEATIAAIPKLLPNKLVKCANFYTGAFWA